jgi:hypothetical protein
MLGDNKVMKKLARSDSGFAIPTILGLGIVAGFWILGTAVPITGL